jgi:hypothetical protein
MAHINGTRLMITQVLVSADIIRTRPVDEMSPEQQRFARLTAVGDQNPIISDDRQLLEIPHLSNLLFVRFQ